MSLEIKDHTEDTYWIARSDDNSIIHYGLLKVDNVMNSGQDVLETFLSKSDCNTRLLELGINKLDLII